MEEDRYTRITLRIPRELHAALTAEADSTSKSLNAEIIARLQDSFDTQAALPEIVRTEVEAAAEKMGISQEDALVHLVMAGASPNAPAVLYVKASPGMTLEQYVEIFEVAKKYLPPDATITLDHG